MENGACDPASLVWRVLSTHLITGGSSWYVFDNMDGTEESINFLKASLVDNSDEFYSSILVNQGVIGTYLPAQQIDAYDEGDEYFGGQKIYSAFREWIPEISRC